MTTLRGVPWERMWCHAPSHVSFWQLPYYSWRDGRNHFLGLVQLHIACFLTLDDMQIEPLAYSVDGKDPLRAVATVTARALPPHLHCCT